MTPNETSWHEIAQAAMRENERLQAIINKYGADAQNYANEKLRQENKRLRSAISGLASVTCLNFLRDQINCTFQMQGAYDGAMSDECKERLKQEHDNLMVLDQIARESLDNEPPHDGGWVGHER